MEYSSQSSANPKHYRVVRFMDQFPLGRVRQVLATNLTWDEAEQIAQESTVDIPTEEVVIEDQGDPSREFNVKPVISDPDSSLPS